MSDPARRRVLIRVIGAPLLLAALGGIVALDRWLQKPVGLVALLGLFAIASYRELCAMASRRGLAPARDVGTLILLVVYGAVWWGLLGKRTLDPTVLVILALLTMLMLMVVRAGTFGASDAGFSFLSLAYVLLLLFAALPLKSGMSFRAWQWWLVFLVAACKGSDMAAYSVGKVMGRHKLAPRISPGKTWEGAIAGLIAGACLGALVLQRTSAREAYGHADGELALLPAVLIAAIVAIAGQLGDLVKSAIKRWADVKDSGRLLPEFGGALDMCDSFLVAAPVAWMLMQP